MLVLSRRCNEELVIDGGIRVKVLEVRGGVVRLGISAPDSVRVLRSELEARETTETLICLPKPNLEFRTKSRGLAGLLAKAR